MKKLLSLILVFILLLAGCSNDSGSVSSVNASSLKNTMSSSDQTSSKDNSSSNASSKVTLGIKNPLDLYGKTYEEIKEIFGSNHSEPVIFEGSIYITYNDDYNIHFEYIGEAIKPTDIVICLTLFKPFDIYKGIRVGKTLDQMNSNKSLLNKLVAEHDFDNGLNLACATFKHNNKDIVLYVKFDENYVCYNIGVHFDKQKDEVLSFTKI